jgi:DNA mismatch repair protein MutS2
MTLDAPTLSGLDWPLLLDALARCARTEPGARHIAELVPMTTRERVDNAYDAIDEFTAIESTGAEIPVAGISDISDDVRRATVGHVLDNEVLRRSAHSLKALSDLHIVLTKRSEEAPTLAGMAAGIDVDPQIAESLFAAFTVHGDLCPKRYPQLRELRRRIASIHTEIRATLDELVNGDTLADLLQDRFWTQRENRYVLPIKVHAKRWDLGLVHGTSSSGQTAFIEPHGIIDLNNRLRLVEGELTAAEYKIRADLSSLIASIGSAVQAGLQVAVQLDVVAARSGFARLLGAHRPEVGLAGVVTLHKARHPVLVLRDVEVVANDLALTRACPTLIISGPNAGGKTIALKTIGLCALLVQHGCFVPADEGSRVDLFGVIRAAIGDQQTVERDLSSFSAHCETLAAMLADAGPDHLILLDELANGTDPGQGAALAQAIIEALSAAGSRVVVTTHFARLKALGAATENIGIAAVQYADGQATYRVLAGVSGESHALSIAEKMGISTQILDRSIALMEGEAGLTRTLEALEEEHQRAIGAAERAEALEVDLQVREQKLAAREAKIRSRSADLEAEGARAFLLRLSKAEKAIGAVVADLQRSPDQRRAKAARQSLHALRTLVGASDSVSSPDDAPISTGDRVRLTRVGREGTVLSAAGNNLRIRTSGGLTVSAKRADVTRLSTSETPASMTGGVTVERKPLTAALDAAVRLPTNTLDMRGMRVDEGYDAADKFFDTAVLRGHSTVFLLHGHGSGALKDGLRSWLNSSSYVADWTPANAEQGGDAFTIVELA